MELTKKQKIMLGVLAVAVTGLAVDRFMLAQPASAEASNGLSDSASASALATGSSAETSPTPQAGSVPSEADSDLPNYAGLNHRLADLVEGGSAEQGAADVFAEPDHWRQVVSVKQAEAPAEPAGPIHSSKRFLDTYKLSSVIDSQEGAVAVINHKQYTEGQALETFVLRGFIEKSSFGRAALWESLRDGQLVVMPVSR